MVVVWWCGRFMKFGIIHGPQPYKSTFSNPCEFIRFGAVDATKPYELIRFGAVDVTKPYKFIGFGTADKAFPGALPPGPGEGPGAPNCVKNNNFCTF